MEELLKALKEGDEEQINIKAQDLFYTTEGHLDRGQVNEFEHFAPCNVEASRAQRSGYIQYHDKTYMFG